MAESSGTGLAVPSAVPATMQAVVAYAPHDYRWEEVETPQLATDELLLEVEACGVCASDVKCFNGSPSHWGGPDMAPWVKAPMIPGHEVLGRVVAAGDGATSVHGASVGDRVVTEPIVPCGACRYCLRGEYWMCDVHDIFGFQNHVNGGWAEYMKVPAAGLVHKVPESMPVQLAVLAEPFSCAVHAVERARIAFGDVVVISGCGPLGLGMVGLARLRGPQAIVALDMNTRRLALAKEFGATHTFNPQADDVVQEIQEMTGGYGCDVYIDAAGHPSSVTQGLAAIRRLGRFVEFSVFNEPTTVDWSLIGEKKELDIYGSHLGPYTFPSAIDFLANGAVNMNGVVTHELPLKDYETAVDLVAAGNESIKVVLRP